MNRTKINKFWNNFYKNFIYRKESNFANFVSKKYLKNKKKIYRITNKNLWGIDLKPDFPKYPDIIIKNDFSKSPKDLSLILMKKLLKYKNFFSR
jgi:hypothetical protein